MARSLASTNSCGYFVGMSERSDHRTASGTARPMRVAYLVDLANCPDELLDAIFAEAHSRWGGRRTLIVPTTVEGIDQRYAAWLQYLDPDVIYSFVELSDAAVAAMHERYAPAHLIRHQDSPGGRSIEIRIPYGGLSSLSVLPVFCSRSWGFDGRPNNVKVLDKYWDQSKSRFLAENFGFLSDSFSSGTWGIGSRTVHEPHANHPGVAA